MGCEKECEIIFKVLWYERDVKIKEERIVVHLFKDIVEHKKFNDLLRG